MCGLNLSRAEQREDDGATRVSESVSEALQGSGKQAMSQHVVMCTLDEWRQPFLVYVEETC